MTHRTVDLGFRMLMALQGHALEWDISSCSAAELEQLTAWTALARELRPPCTPATSPAPRPPTARSR